MPAILTHDFFGRDALGIARDLIGLETKEEEEIFLLGNQGPDPLFYLVIDPLIDKQSRVGGLMHHARPASLLFQLRAKLDGLSGRTRVLARAWLAGFMGHYLLDRSMHPLVYFWQYGICANDPSLSGGDVHAEIERDFDEMVLFTKRGETIETYRPFEEVLQSTNDALSAVDTILAPAIQSCYGVSINPNTFLHAAHSFRVMQRVFYSPQDTPRNVLGTIERAVTGKAESFYCAMSHLVRASDTSDFDNRERHQWEDPFTHELRGESFWDLYEAALSQYASFGRAYLLEEVSEIELEDMTRNLNFSGEPVDPALVEDEA